MYLSHCPQVTLRHVVTRSELTFVVTRGSLNLSAVRRGSNRRFRRSGSTLPIVRCEGSRNGREAKAESRDGALSKAWSALRALTEFPNLTKFAKGLSPMERKLCGAGIVCALAAIAWLRNLNAAGLVDDTEPLFAEAARQMLLTGDYITPQFNAQPRFDKPVLIYWLMALSGKLLGPSVWALRLPSAMCALGLLVGLLVTVNEFGLTTSVDDDAATQLGESQAASSSTGDHYVPAVITIAAFALNLEVVAWGSTALCDMLLTSMLGGSLLSFFWGYAGRQLAPAKHEWGYALSAVFAGLACLSKGPVGIVFPISVCTLFLLSTGELSQVLIEEMPPYWKKGILALLLTNIPWYGAMAAKHGLTYIYIFFGYHNIERFMQGVNHHGGRPWWYGLAVIAVMYFPWSLSLPPALLQAGPWRQSWRKSKRCQRLSSFAASWLIAGFVLFALSSSQLPSYYLPVAPAIALLAAAVLHASKGGVLSRLAPGILYLLLVVGFWYLPACLQNSGDTVAAKIGRLVSDRHLHTLAGVLFALAGVVTFWSAVNARLRPAAELKAETGSVEKPANVTFLPLWVVHTTVMACFLGMFLTPAYTLTDSIRQAPLRHVAHAAATQQKTGEPLVMVGTRMPSVVYYSKLPTAFFNSPPEALVVIQEEAAAWVTSALIITENEADLFQPPPDILATCGEYKLLRWHRRAQEHSS